MPHPRLFRSSTDALRSPPTESLIGLPCSSMKFSSTHRREHSPPRVTGGSLTRSTLRILLPSSREGQPRLHESILLARRHSVDEKKDVVKTDQSLSRSPLRLDEDSKPGCNIQHLLPVGLLVQRVGESHVFGILFLVMQSEPLTSENAGHRLQGLFLVEANPRESSHPNDGDRQSKSCRVSRADRSE